MHGFAEIGPDYKFMADRMKLMMCQAGISRGRFKFDQVVFSFRAFRRKRRQYWQVEMCDWKLSEIILYEVAKPSPFYRSLLHHVVYGQLFSVAVVFSRASSLGDQTGWPSLSYDSLARVTVEFVAWHWYIYIHMYVYLFSKSLQLLSCIPDWWYQQNTERITHLLATKVDNFFRVSICASLLLVMCSTIRVGVRSQRFCSVRHS